MSQMTKPLAAFSSIVSSAAAIALAWSAVDSLNDWGKSAPFAAGALGLHYVGVGIRRKYELSWADHKAIAPEVWECLCLGYGDTQTYAQSVVSDFAEMPGVDRVSTPTLDLTPILTHSSAIVAPTGTGKSFFLSMLMVERQRQFPGTPFKICSVDTWKRNHTWMGLASCPDWLKRVHICLGHKYPDDKFTEAIHKEAINEVERLHEAMEKRAAAVRDNGGESGVDLTLSTLIIDEFPQFYRYLDKSPNGDEVKDMIRDLLVRGHGYRCILYVVSQDDAVNMMGIKQSEKKQLFICSLFKKNVGGDDARSALINSVPGRRVLFEHNGDGAIAPIPHMDSEPKLNWQTAIEKGKFRGWVEDLTSDIQKWKSDGATVTASWEELTKRSDFPAKLKRQGRDNPDYTYFVDSIWSKIK